jgi:PTS system nitrogen regulatory IIA component
MSDLNEEGLAELVERGGIFYHIPGHSPEQILTEIIEKIPMVFAAAPSGGQSSPTNEQPGGSTEAPIDKGTLLKMVLEREALMSTGLGHGLAIPHPRNPVISEAKKQFVTIAFPESPVDWNSLDGKAVYAVLLIVSASAKLHLHTLSKINFLCQQKNFETLLRNHGPREDIIKAIRETEQTWKK